MIRSHEAAIYAGAFLLSLVGHWGLIGGLSSAAEGAPAKRPRVLEFEVIKPPEPEPEPERPEPPPPPEPKEVDLTEVVVPDEDVPPPPNEPGEEEPEEVKPVFGVSMSSVVGPGKGGGFKVRVGNTLMKDPEEEFVEPEKVKPYKPVPLFKVTRRPKFTRGLCKPDYPPEAKRLGIEGRVQLEVELRADGTVGDVKVVKGLGHGLDEVAVEAIKKCPFEPGQISGKAVTTRITVGITFVIED
ncbi:energy transducer TonB [Myxococcota bacterium]